MSTELKPRGIHRLWIPVSEGERRCVCCGSRHGGITLPCGDHYCGICEGRGHEEPHEAEDCRHGEDSPIFSRLDSECMACGRRHDDWETCANAIWDYAKANGIDSITQRFRIIDGQVLSDES